MPTTTAQPHELAAALYPELRRLASKYLRHERSGHTLHTTALVHEAYARLAASRAEEVHREAFLRAAASVMRRVLVDYARARKRIKRGGGGRQRVSLDTAAQLHAETKSAANGIDLCELDEALAALSAIDARRVQIVELRFFAGLTEEQIAAVMNLSTRAIKKDWRITRAWLLNRLCAREN